MVCSLNVVKCCVNDNKVFSEKVPAYHDRAYHYHKKVKNGEKLRLEICWQPHDCNDEITRDVVNKLCSSNIHKLCVEESNLYGTESMQKECNDISRKNKHFSIMGICVSRDFVTMAEEEGCVVDRFVQDINPISLNYSSILGGGISLTEEDVKEYLIDKQLSHFHLRNTMLDINKTAYEYLFEVKSDYLILDVGCLRFHVMVDEKRNRAITKPLLERLHWSDENKDYRDIGTLEVEERDFKDHMDKFIHMMLERYREENIILVEVYQADFYVDKSCRYIKRFGGDNTEGNRAIKRGFEYLKKTLPRAHVIPFVSNVIGDENHKWRLGSLHFVPEYYEYGHKALLVAISGYSAEYEHHEMEMLCRECGRKIEMNYMFEGRIRL